jgi:sorbitol/mannitol transport system permease protein
MTSADLFWAKMSAASTVAIAPVFIAGWAAQRALVRGLTMGAVKKGPSVVSGGGL